MCLDFELSATVSIVASSKVGEDFSVWHCCTFYPRIAQRFPIGCIRVAVYNGNTVQLEYLAWQVGDESVEPYDASLFSSSHRTGC